MEKIELTNDQMNVMLVAVEHGYKQCEKGHNLQAALASVYDLYEVKHSHVRVGDARTGGATEKR